MWNSSTAATQTVSWGKLKLDSSVLSPALHLNLISYSTKLEIDLKKKN